MSRTVKIPECMNPFDVWVNGAKYSYPAGTEQEVPDNVADVIEHHIAQKKAEPAGVNACNADLVISAVTDGMFLNIGTANLSVKSGSLRSVFERLKANEEVKVILEHEYWYNDIKYLGVLYPIQVTSGEYTYGGVLHQYISAVFCASNVPFGTGLVQALSCMINIKDGTIDSRFFADLG